MTRYLTSAAILALATAPQLASAQSVELIYNSYLPPFNETFQVGIRDLAAAITEQSGGEIAVSIPDSSLAPANRQYEMVRDGIADMAVVATGSVAQLVTLNELAELPGMSPTAEAGSVALWETYNEHFAPVGEWDGVVVLSTHVLPGRDLLSLNGLTVSGIPDVAGRRLWATASAFVAATDAMGAVAVDTDFGELQEFAARGDLDGMFITPGSADSAGVLEMVGQIGRLPGGFGTVSFAVIVNGDVWAGLSEEHKAAILRAADGLPRRLGAANDASEREVADKVAAIPTTVFEGEALAGFQAAMAPQIEAWKAAAVEAGLADPQAAIDYYMGVLARETGS